MYKNPGEEIKMKASVLTVLLSIPSVLSGIFLISCAKYFFAEYAPQLFAVGCLLGLSVIAIGVWLARVLGSIMYGFGVLVDRVDHLNSQFFSENAAHEYIHKDSEPSETLESAEGCCIVPLKKDKTWVCPFCDHINPSTTTECENCGIMVQFSK